MLMLAPGLLTLHMFYGKYIKPILDWMVQLSLVRLYFLLWKTANNFLLQPFVPSELNWCLFGKTNNWSEKILTAVAATCDMENDLRNIARAATVTNCSEPFKSSGKMNHFWASDRSKTQQVSEFKTAATDTQHVSLHCDINSSSS